MQFEFPVPESVRAELVCFPQNRAAKWRLEMGRCESYDQALAIMFRMIRELEELEPDEADVVAVPNVPRATHQLAFPWARAD